MLEKNIEEYFRVRVKSLGGIALKINSSSMRGLPDRMVLLPKGRLYFIELKAPGKKPNPVQLAVHRLLKNMGFKVLVIDSKEKVGEFINGVYTAQVSENSN